MLGHLALFSPEAVVFSFSEQATVLISAALTVVVIATLAVSGALKLGHTAETFGSFESLGVPSILRHRMLAATVPGLELLLALGLLLAPFAVFTVTIAITTLVFVFYLALVVRVVARRQQAECRCFGALSSARVTRWSVARNAALVGAAVVVLFGGGEGVLLTLDGFTASMVIEFLVALLVVVTVLLAVTAVRLARRESGGATQLALTRGTASGASAAAAQPRFDGTPWAVPDLEVTTQAGDVVSLSSVAALRPTLVVLLSAECTPCRAVVARMPEWAFKLRPAVDLVVLTSERRDVAARAFGELSVPVYIGYRALLTVTGIAGVPSALLLAPDSMVVAGPAEGLDEVIEMTEAIVASVTSAQNAENTQHADNAEHAQNDANSQRARNAQRA